VKETKGLASHGLYLRCKPKDVGHPMEGVGLGTGLGADVFKTRGISAGEREVASDHVW